MDGAEIISTRKSTDTWSKMGAISDIYITAIAKGLQNTAFSR